MTYLIYGANGYTGELIARGACQRGHAPLLAGRNHGTVTALARELGLRARVFELASPEVMREQLAGVSAVLNCAGPFAHTARPMLDACLHAGVHYLDITGDPLVLEALAARAPEARARGVMILPGVGFDVVVSDCLALYLKQRLPSADRLVLGFHGVEHHSRGSRRASLERIGRPGLLRRDGRLASFPAGSRARLIDFGRGPQLALGIAFGDLCTAYHSTGLPNIEVFAGAPRAALWALRATGALRPLLQSAPLQRWLLSRESRRPRGPSVEQRAAGRTLFWGEVSDRQGRSVAARVQGPEAYALTALSALEVMDRMRTQEARPGFQTPSQLWGADFSLAIPDVERCDV